MASDKVQTITDSNFESTIKNATVPVLVDFWAEWCQPCLRLGPTVDGLAAEFDGKLIVGKMNVDENPTTPSRFGVRSIPMLVLFKGGQAVDQSIGLVSKDELKKMVTPHVAG
ncbi:MAG: thioredoxin [Acidobacteria bacterium]|nr:thioredoxin [Acidobacteriota bacterium]